MITAIMYQVQGYFVPGFCTKLQDTKVAHIYKVNQNANFFENSKSLLAIFTR